MKWNILKVAKNKFSDCTVQILENLRPLQNALFLIIL